MSGHVTVRPFKRVPYFAREIQARFFGAQLVQTVNDTAIGSAVLYGLRLLPADRPTRRHTHTPTPLRL